MTLEHMLSHLLLNKIIGGALAMAELLYLQSSNYEYYLRKKMFLNSVILVLLKQDSVVNIRRRKLILS
jgi:hypothetical protein